MLNRSVSSGSIGSNLSHGVSGIGRALKRVNSISSIGSSLSSPLNGSWASKSGFHVGLQGQKDASRAQDVVDEEVGEWHYLVIDPSGIRAREVPNYTKETKRTDVYFRHKEGTIVTIERRRTAGWTKWLGLRGGDGWLFDVSPKDKKVRLVEVEVVNGAWQYECLVERAPVLQKPLPSQASAPAKKNQMVLCMREVVHVQEKVRALNSKGSFLKLSDGRGWVLDYVDGRQVLQRQWSSYPDEDPAMLESDVHTMDSPLARGSSGSGRSDVMLGAHQNRSFGGRAEFGSGNGNGGGYRSNSSFLEDTSDPLPGVGTGLGRPETGNWDFIVVDPKGVSLRSSPAYDQKQKTTKRVEEGQVVTVLERIPGEGTTFLRLEDPQGWCFDRQPGGGTNTRLRMMETVVERGHWNYYVVAERGVALRSRCSFSELAKTGKGPLKGALVDVIERVRAGESTFLRLQDGSGWIFDLKKGKRVVQGPIDMQVLPPLSMASVRLRNPGDKNRGINLLCSPTLEKWAVTKYFLLDNSKVRATKMCEVDSNWWIYVTKGAGGMEGWAPSDSMALESSPDFMRIGQAATPADTRGYAEQDISAPHDRFGGCDRFAQPPAFSSPPPPDAPLANATMPAPPADFRSPPPVGSAFAAPVMQEGCAFAAPAMQGSAVAAPDFLANARLLR